MRIKGGVEFYLGWLEGLVVIGYVNKDMRVVRE